MLLNRPQALFGALRTSQTRGCPCPRWSPSYTNQDRTMGSQQRHNSGNLVLTSNDKKRRKISYFASLNLVISYTYKMKSLSIEEVLLKDLFIEDTMVDIFD